MNGPCSARVHYISFCRRSSSQTRRLTEKKRDNGFVQDYGRRRASGLWHGLETGASEHSSFYEHASKMCDESLMCFMTTFQLHVMYTSGHGQELRSGHRRLARLQA